MSRHHKVVLTRAARDAGIPLDRLHDAAIAAAGDPLDAEVWFRTFRVGGRQFALSTRIVVEVDHFPHRVPARTFGPPAAGRTRR